MFRSYKYRIYPTKKQLELIEQTFGCCRLVYNIGLTVKKTAWEGYKKNISRYDLQKQLTDLKTDESFKWLKNVDSQALQYSLKNLNDSYNNFFKNKTGHPKYKLKSGKQSFTCHNNTRKVDFIKNTITIPKIKDIPAKISRTFQGEVRTITISKTPTGKYFAAILVKDLIEKIIKPQPNSSKAIGIDLGLSHFLITDTGIKIENPRFLRKSIERLKNLQRRASKKKKGSANRKKANLKVALQYEKITNQRLDFIHKLTHKLTHDSQVDTICMEDLNVTGMVMNHKLAQAISDVSWTKFRNTLAYKCEWHGKNLVFINRFEPSSKKCSSCGFLNKEMTLSIREWTCSNCGASHDRDINAAINIKNAGLGKSGEPVESLAIAKAKKQEIN